MKQAIFNRVRSIIAEELGVEPEFVTMDARLCGDRLSADSLELICLIVAFVTEFDVEIEDQEIKKVVTVGDMVHYLDKRLRTETHEFVPMEAPSTQVQVNREPGLILNIGE